MFGVLRTCSPNTRDSAGFAGFSLRVCAVTRVGWVGWDLAWDAARFEKLPWTNLVQQILETFLQKFVCLGDFQKSFTLKYLQTDSDVFGNS